MDSLVASATEVIGDIWHDEHHKALFSVRSLLLSLMEGSLSRRWLQGFPTPRENSPDPLLGYLAGRVHEHLNSSSLYSGQFRNFAIQHMYMRRHGDAWHLMVLFPGCKIKSENVHPSSEMNTVVGFEIEALDGAQESRVGRGAISLMGQPLDRRSTACQLEDHVWLADLFDNWQPCHFKGSCVVHPAHGNQALELPFDVIR